jgi:hypothetical protein
MDEIPPTELQVILDHIYAGHKIEAVKHYKELRGVSLLEAKQFIEKLTDELREQSPEKFAPSPKSGCLGTILLGTILLCFSLSSWTWIFRDHTGLPGSTSGIEFVDLVCGSRPGR